MRVLEFVLASVLALMGLRSLVHWARRPLESGSLRDHVVFALWALSRAGLWFAVAGIFAISASIHYRGRAFLDAWSRYRWYIMVPLACAVVQAFTSYALGKSSDG